VGLKLRTQAIHHLRASQLRQYQLSHCPAEDVHETSQFPLFPEERTGLEALQVESLEVKQSTRLGIGVEVDLETAIEEEAIHKIGANTPTDGVGCFEDEDFATGFVEAQGGA
jgi:RecB family endonuclease NucS